jgi:hypothetical protein
MAKTRLDDVPSSMRGTDLEKGYREQLDSMFGPEQPIGSVARSTSVCSGLVWGGSTATVTIGYFDQQPERLCRRLENCSMEILEESEVRGAPVAEKQLARSQEGPAEGTAPPKGASPGMPEPIPRQIPAPPDVKAPPRDARRTPSGLAYRVLLEGTGREHPRANSVVTVQYTGWTTDGQMFDSSVARGQPAKFPLDRVIRGWTEGVQLMVVGQKVRFWIPARLAYGLTPTGGRPAGMLIFDVELLEFERP